MGVGRSYHKDSAPIANLLLIAALGLAIDRDLRRRVLLVSLFNPLGELC